MQPKSAVTATLVVVGVVSTLTACRTPPPDSGSSSAAARTTFERVTESGQLRCGYVTYPPGLIKEPNTGTLSGTFHDIVEEAARNLGLKVAWVEEVGWGTMIEGLQTGRYDMICSPVWPLSQRVKLADFSVPIYYGGAGAYVRAGDTRFDRGPASLNDQSVKVATIDGEVTDMIARMKFPNARRMSLPQATDISQALLDVSTQKADVTFVESYVAHEFVKANPKSVRALYPGRPLVVYPNTFMFKPEQSHFKTMLDNALLELLNNGFVDAVLDKYEPAPNVFYRRSMPYRGGSE